MSEEVVINVKQESQGNALADAAARIDQLKKRIAELNSLEANYAAKGIPGTTDLSKERTALQRELTGLEKTQLAERKAADATARSEAKERHKIEAGITDEHRRREAVAAARARSAANLAERAAGISGMGDATSLVSGIGGTAGIAATVAMAVAAVGTAIAGTIQERFRSQRLIELEGNTASVRQGQHLKRMAEPGGSDAASANAEAKAARDEYIARTEQGKEIKERAKPRWYNPTEFGLWAWNKATGDELQTREGRDEDQRNDKAKELALQRESGAKEIRKKKWAEEGAVELEGRQAEINRDMVGKRFADDKLAALREYNRIVNAIGGSTAREKADAEAVATEGATSLVQLRQRERAGNIGGLVNARTGTRGTAQLARIAAGLDSPGRASEVVAAIHGLNGTVKQGAQPPLHDWMKTRGR